MPRWIIVVIGVFLLSACGAAGAAAAQQNSEVIDPGSLALPAAEDYALPTTADDALQPFPNGASGDAAECCNSGCDGGCETCGGAYGVYFWAQWLHGTCDMPPRYPYFPSMHGYYYFRPYHQMHVMQQQAVVIGWGGDARNPYGNEIFKKVYAEYRADHDTSLKSVIPPILESPIPEDPVLEEPTIGN